MIRHLTLAFLALLVLASQAKWGGGASILKNHVETLENVVDDEESPASHQREEGRLPQLQVKVGGRSGAHQGSRIVSGLNTKTVSL